MFTVLLPPGVIPFTVKKYGISHHIIYFQGTQNTLKIN